MPARSPLPAEMEAPSHPRHFRLYPFQWVAIPLLFLVPVLALFGVFGETTAEVQDDSATLAMRVVYKDRYRYKQLNPVEVAVQNRTARTLDTLVVSFDPEYARKFSAVAFIPPVEEPFVVELLGVEPGEVKRVWAEFQGDRYGRHRGSISAYARGSADTVAVTIQTTIYP